MNRALFLAFTLLAMNVHALERATFAGGCFWCMEPPFEKVNGVQDAVSGYAGGEKDNPKYDEVSAGGTGHTEVVQVIFDPKKVTYEKLLDVFWRNIDPTDKDGQFVDRGSQYRPAIFYHDDNQKKTAETSKQALEKSGRFKKPIVVEITALKKFYPAEAYHQNFYKKPESVARYKQYRKGSGRDAYIESVWGPSTH